MEQKKEQKLSLSPFYALKRYSLKSICRSAFSLAISDVVVVSFRKSGRTWLRLMLSKVIADQYKMKDLKLDTEYMTLFKSLPNVMFSQAGTTQTNNKLDFRKIYRKKKVVLMIRDPRAVLVSLYHDYNSRKVWKDGKTMSEFIHDPNWGLHQVITFMNLWAGELKRRDDILVLKYEDLYLDTMKEMKRFLEYLPLPADDAVIESAIIFGSPKNMRKMEQEKTFNDARMLPANANDPNSYTARKCKLGSFREELDSADLDYITKEMKLKLDPVFGYE